MLMVSMLQHGWELCLLHSNFQAKRFLSIYFVLECYLQSCSVIGHLNLFSIKKKTANAETGFDPISFLVMAAGVKL